MAPSQSPNHARLSRRDAAAATTSSSPSLYLGLGLGVGAALLLAIVIVVVLVVKKRREHKRLIEVLEVEAAVQDARRQEVGEVCRSGGVGRRASFARAGWGPLASTETVDVDVDADVQTGGAETGRGRGKRGKRRGKGKRGDGGAIPLKRWKRLTAILESPRSRDTMSPAVVAVEPHVQLHPVSGDLSLPAAAVLKAYTMRKVSDDVFLSPGSPKADVLPSFAIRSPRRYGAGLANDGNTIENVKASRSWSVGALGGPTMASQVVSGAPQRLARPPMHARSISLGAPPSRPPSCPVPPLPVIEPHANLVDPLVRRGLHVSRMSSSSSQGSAGSSVLVTSPILTMHDQSHPLSSPTVAQVVADDDGASLKNVATRQWPRPRTKSGRFNRGHPGSKSKCSIRSNMATYSVESLASRRLSTASVDSLDEVKDGLAVVETGLAERVSISRVSSNNSLASYTGVQRVITPRKPKRSSVSASGSPAERRKMSILRDLSGNSFLGPSRQPSNATQDSGRSSNGNPFQWDQPMPKPSALKGSPNARKGHRRQSCVRISTLTPQILGPPPSRPTSPSIMHGIEEESSDDQELGDSTRLRFVTNQRTSRPASSASFAPNLRIQTLRASLTPSSPTLSAWNAYQEHGLPSLPSDSQISFSPSQATRSRSRESNHSSPFTIPSFPSPSKATLTDIQLSHPVPQFCLSRPSSERNENDNDNDNDDNDDNDDTSSPPFGLHLSSDHSIPSSPPAFVSNKENCDPAHPGWSSVTFEVPQETRYDPASPSWLDATEPERSSGLFPFAAAAGGATECEDGGDVSAQVLPNPYGVDLPDTPPCSPKSIQAGLRTVFANDRQPGNSSADTEEPLTSSNASAIMARLSARNLVDFPGAPILAPPQQNLDCYSQTTPERPLPLQTSGRARAFSSTTATIPHAPALHSGQPDPMPTIPSSDLYSDVEPCSDDDHPVPIPSPLTLPSKTPFTKPTSPSLLNGPRTQPSPSVRHTAAALRRMNSEANATHVPSSTSAASLVDPDVGRASRMYVRMGREASPLLPWIGGEESGMFDFGFGGDESGAGQVEGGAVEEEEGWRSALEEIDLGVVERKLEGALVGFESEVSRDEGSVDMEIAKSHVPEWSGFGARSAGMVTPRKGGGRPMSIQMTPRSLYDSDGFLRT